MNSSPTGDASGARKSSWVLDASALLAVLLEETGGEAVLRAIAEGASMSAVNFSESISRMLDLGAPSERVLDRIVEYGIDVLEFDSEAALQTALFRQLTRSQGLSLGDRSCLALAQRLDLPALTADRQWATVDVGVRIVVCR
jgi:ribonuclease VapC